MTHAAPVETSAAKRCSRCTRVLDASAFYRNKRCADGLNAYCKECSNAISAAWWAAHPEKRLERQRRWRRNNLDRARAQNRRWKRDNPEKVSEEKRKFRQTSGGRVVQALRARVQQAIRRGYKSARTVELLGCSVEELIRHLESLFARGMSWDNYGREGWHIDHVRPCSSFDLLNPEEQRQCFHWSNLQPLWGLENLSKGSKYSQTGTANKEKYE